MRLTPHFPDVRSAVRAVAFLGGLSGFGPSILATVNTWDGGGSDSNFSTAANWNPDVAPVNEGTADLHFAGAVRLSPNAQSAYSVRSISFDSGASAFSIAGQTLTIVAGGISNNSTSIQTINNTVAVPVSQTWNTGTGSAPIKLGQDLTVGMGATLSLNKGATSLTGTSSVLRVDGAVDFAANMALSGTASLTTKTAYTGYNGKAGVTQSAGTFTTGTSNLYIGYNTGSTGVYALSGTGSLTTTNTYVGYDGTGTFTQNGGTLKPGNLYLGNNNGGKGTFTLENATAFTTGYLYVGNNGAGTFTQNGGVVSAGIVDVAYGSTGTGTYTFNGGTIGTGLVAVGLNGTGVFTQNSGTTLNLHSGALSLGQNFSGNGTFNFAGGDITGVVSGGQGTSAFNFDGGTLHASGPGQIINYLTSLNVRAGGAKLDTTSYNCTVGQPFLHDTAKLDSTPDGGLTKIGTGALTLTGANTYTGDTKVSAGTLALADAATLAATPNINVAAGAIFDVTAPSGGFNPATGQTLTDNGTVNGRLGVAGVLTGSGTVSNPVAVLNGGVLSGPLTCNGPLTVNSGGSVALAGGTLTVNASITNNGTVRLTGGAQLVVGNGNILMNNGTLDIITGGFSAPAGFINNGVVLDSSVVRVKSVSRDNAMIPATVTVAVDGYTGHTYTLQRSSSLTDGEFTPVDGVPSQKGVTGATLIFTDPAASDTQGFYRVRVDP